MRVLDLLEHLDVVELDVEVLVDALEDAADLDVVFELDGDLVVDQGFEEAGVVGCEVRGVCVKWGVYGPVRGGREAGAVTAQGGKLHVESQSPVGLKPSKVVVKR